MNMDSVPRQKSERKSPQSKSGRTDIDGIINDFPATNSNSSSNSSEWDLQKDTGDFDGLLEYGRHMIKSSGGSGFTVGFRIQDDMDSQSPLPSGSGSRVFHESGSTIDVKRLGVKKGKEFDKDGRKQDEDDGNIPFVSKNQSWPSMILDLTENNTHHDDVNGDDDGDDKVTKSFYDKENQLLLAASGSFTDMSTISERSKFHAHLVLSPSICTDIDELISEAESISSENIRPRSVTTSAAISPPNHPFEGGPRRRTMESRRVLYNKAARGDSTNSLSNIQFIDNVTNPTLHLHDAFDNLSVSSLQDIDDMIDIGQQKDCYADKPEGKYISVTDVAIKAVDIDSLVQFQASSNSSQTGSKISVLETADSFHSAHE